MNSLNVNGGAIAWPNPLGATGRCSSATVLDEMSAATAERRWSSFCGGAGMGPDDFSDEGGSVHWRIGMLRTFNLPLAGRSKICEHPRANFGWGSVLRCYPPRKKARAFFRPPTRGGLIS